MGRRLGLRTRWRVRAGNKRSGPFLVTSRLRISRMGHSSFGNVCPQSAKLITKLCRNAPALRVLAEQWQKQLLVDGWQMKESM